MSAILYLDTSAQESLVMLIRKGLPPVIRSNSVPKDHGQVINLHIADVMTEAKVSWQDLQAVCVLNGPGSYTGLRMSLGTAKGICYAQDIPLVLLNKLDLLFHHIPLAQRTALNGILIHARAGEYFFAAYGAQGEVLVQPGLSTSDELNERMSSQTLKLFSIDELPFADFRDCTLIQVYAEQVAEFCLLACEARQYADLFISEPFYLKNVHINKINNL